MAQALVPSERLQGLFGVGDVLDDFEVSAIDNIFAAFRAARVATDPAEKLAALCLYLSRCAAAVSGGIVDGQVASALETIMQGPLKDSLLAIVVSVSAQVKAGVVFATSTDFLNDQERADFVASNVAPALVLTIVKLLLKYW